MKIRQWHKAVMVLALMALGLGLGCVAAKKVVTTKPADLKHGGQLYDKWMKLRPAKLEGSHPLYPAEAKKQGESSWRCKECHGWDYIGDKGRYSEGSHYTGITGVYDARSKPTTELYAALRDAAARHSFAEFLTEEDLWALTTFLKEGLVDINTVIDAAGNAKGDPVNGKALFAVHCAGCHDEDGDAIDFKDKKDGIQGVAYYAKGNPQETIHKIRWGHPGSDMPSMLVDAGLSEAEARDILAYSQTLK